MEVLQICPRDLLPSYLVTIYVGGSREKSWVLYLFPSKMFVVTSYFFEIGTLMVFALENSCPSSSHGLFAGALPVWGCGDQLPRESSSSQGT